jgi:glycine/D-amino acid oxidase-like deaminating enzyme
MARKAGIRIKKVAALHVVQPPPADCPILYFFDEDAFLMPVPELGRWILSFTSQEWDCLPDRNALRISKEERHSAMSTLGKHLPQLVPYCLGGQVFCDAYSRDWAPVVLADPADQDFVIAGACSGAGFRLAPAIARSALHLLSGFSGNPLPV